MPDCIVKKQVHMKIRSLGLHTAGNVPEKLEELVMSILESAAERAKKNGRKTVMAYDIA